MKKKIKIKNILVIALVFLLFLGIGAYFVITKRNELKVEMPAKITLELNEEKTNLAGVKVEHGSIVSKEEMLDTSKIGEYEVKILIKDVFDKEHEYTYAYEVVDRTPPKITFQGQIEVEYGAEVDLLKDVKAEDNSGEEIEVKVEGEFDTYKAGEQELYYVARDCSNNETREKFTLIVKERYIAPKINTQITMPDQEFTTSKGFKGFTKNGITYIDGYLVANKTYSLPQSYNPGGLTSETSNAAAKMFAAAELEGLPHMWAQSGFRSYSTQESLYNTYVARDGKAAADTYSARPGYSEHQSGLAFDVCATGYACITSGFNGTAPANWLSKNAYKYGFILRYPQGKSNETGYMYESWHFRYVGTELAEKLYNNGDWITMEDYFGITSVYSS